MMPLWSDFIFDNPFSIRSYTPVRTTVLMDLLITLLLDILRSNKAKDAPFRYKTSMRILYYLVGVYFHIQYVVPQNIVKLTIKVHISIAYCKTAVTTLLAHWSYCFLVLNHRYYRHRYQSALEVRRRMDAHLITKTIRAMRQVSSTLDEYIKMSRILTTSKSTSSYQIIKETLLQFSRLLEEDFKQIFRYSDTQ